METRFSDDDIQQFFSSGQNPVRKRIEEVIGFLENADNKGREYGGVEYKISDDSLSYKDGWIHADLTMEWSDGDIGGTYAFTFPSRLLSLDDESIIAWIDERQHFLDAKKNHEQAEESLSATNRRIDDLNRGIDNLSDPMWIASRMQALNNALATAEKNRDDKTDVLNTLQEQVQLAGSFEENAEARLENDGVFIVHFPESRLLAINDPSWRDICSPLEKVTNNDSDE